jgi:ankyrin repeat protein
MKANHRLEDNDSSYKILRNYYEEAIQDSKLPKENAHDFELLEAVREGDGKKIRDLLVQNSRAFELKIGDRTTRVEPGAQRWTALHLAAREGHEILAKILLDRGADIHEQSSSGETAFCMAVKAGHSTVAKLLLENGESVHDKLDRGRTALHLAVRGGHEALAKFLIENGASVHERSSSGETALSMAVRAGHTAVVKLLLENGAEVQAITTKTGNRDGNGITPLVLAVNNRHKDVVKILIDYGSIPEKISVRSNALISAIHTKQEDIVALLIESGVDVNRQPLGWGFDTALHAARKAGAAMTKLILEAKGNPEAKNWMGYTPLSWAVRDAREINNEVVRLLIEAGAKITPYHWEKFTPELRKQYADRSPFRPLDPAVPSLDEMLDVDELLRFDRNKEDSDAFDRDNINLSQSPSSMPTHSNLSEGDIKDGSEEHEDEEMIEYWE